MTHRSVPHSHRTQPVCACRDVCAPQYEEAQEMTEREIIKDSAGNVLIAFGAMFAGSPVFRAHIDRSTAEMLVSLGKKLKRK